MRKNRNQLQGKEENVKFRNTNKNMFLLWLRSVFFHGDGNERKPFGRSFVTKRMLPFACMALCFLLSGCKDNFRDLHQEVVTKKVDFDSENEQTRESIQSIFGEETHEIAETGGGESAGFEQSHNQESSEMEAEVTTVSIGGLKGPTSMGMAKLSCEASKSGISYEFQMETTADAIVPMLIRKELDFMAIPSNLAGILYQKTEGEVYVCAINTLGVTYLIDNTGEITSVADLKGKTVYATGQGTIPEYTLRYLLEENGLNPDQDVELQFKSEPTEIVSLFQSADQKEVVAMLPQPFVIAAKSQVENLSIAVDLNEEWRRVTGEENLVTGVLVVRKEFADENPGTVQKVLSDYADSVQYVNGNPEEASAYIEQMGIVKAPIAKRAIPFCHMTCLTDHEMKTRLEEFYRILFEQNPKSVGGALPDESFYYLK